MQIAAVNLIACASALMLMAWPCKAATQEGSIGIVEEIHGTVFWRSNPNAKPLRLDPGLDAARRLYTGEQLRCARGSLLRLRLNGKLKTLRGASAWFTIPLTAASRSDPLQAALDEYGRLGGRDRGSSLQVFSPSDHSVVMPERFVIRWIPSAARCAIAFSIQDGGSAIWQQNDVDGAVGSLAADAAKQALIDYRVKGEQGPLTLKLVDSCGSETHLAFSLLSIKSEQSLKQELAFWDKEPANLLAHLGRASVFNRYRMFPQVAEEYEAALGVTPNSRHLLIRTILAHRGTGNFNRAEKLEKRLPVGTNITQRRPE
ncbi:MAG: hypothetical protein V7641_5453 [Blastocatellia bacterium]